MSKDSFYLKIMPLLVSLSNMLPKRNKVYSNNEIQSQNPFFIIGSGRNGSTLLGSMLNMNPAIAVVPEQFALSYSIIRYKLFNYRSWAALVDDIVSLFESASHWKTDLGFLKKELKSLSKSQQSLRSLIDLIYTGYLNTAGDNYKVWGDKTPRNTIMLDYIYPVYPESKYIFLVRDGRDVVRSYIHGSERFFGRYNKLENAIWLWNNSISRWESLYARVKPNQTFVIQYERLVSEPAMVLMELCEFLNVKYNNAMLNFSKDDRMKVNDLNIHENVSKKINTNSIGSWESYLTDSQKQVVERKMKANLEKWGYM
jgi:protein-tyrosine sulfotransferase